MKHGNHIKPLIELPGFPIDLVKMKIRNRKLLASLNQKKRFKDFEYKNYDSFDSDLYEEEDYNGIKQSDVDAENDFLRQRRLKRRHAVKLEIQKVMKKQEREAAQKRKRVSSQPTGPAHSALH